MKTAALHPLARSVAHYCECLHKYGLSPARSGNVSARDDEFVWITPSGFSLKDVRPEDLVQLWPDGRPLAPESLRPDVGPAGLRPDVGPAGLRPDVGPAGLRPDVGPAGLRPDVGPAGLRPDVGPAGLRPDVGPAGLRPSSEWPMHRRIYETRPDVNAIVHTHPPKATAMAVAHKPLDKKIISEILFTLGEVPLVGYELPGSEALANAAAEGLRSHDAVLLANHGVIAVGKTIDDAYYNLELVESYAEIYILAGQMNALNELTPGQVEEILQLKAQMGHC